MPRRILSSRVLVATRLGEFVEASVVVATRFVTLARGVGTTGSAAGSPSAVMRSRAESRRRLFTQGRRNIGDIRTVEMVTGLQAIGQGQCQPILDIVPVGQIRIPESEPVGDRGVQAEGDLV